MTDADLIQAALELPYEVRVVLARRLQESLLPPGEEGLTPEAWEASWAEEVERRIELDERGEMGSLSVEEAHERVLRSLEQRARQK